MKVLLLGKTPESFKLQTTQLQDELTQRSNDLEERCSKIELLQTSNDEFQNKSHSLNTELALKVQEIDSLKVNETDIYILFSMFSKFILQ